MKYFLVLTIALISQLSFAHDANYENVIAKDWHLTNGKEISGFFFMCKDGKVYLEQEDHSMIHFPVSELVSEDRQFVKEKMKKIADLNKKLELDKTADSTPQNPVKNSSLIILFITVAALGGIVYFKFRKTKLRYIVPVIAVGLISSLFSFTSQNWKKKLSTTDPNTMDLAFTPFKPAINTFWDNNYFYVESKGIPDHEMMAGITGWQQQVPIPQCYVGPNAWSIPLNPVIAITPVPVNTVHFIRGALAVAVNGVPIFNPYTNAGVDAYLAGQLDNFGGHSGRADDYHYHIAPLHLYSQQTNTLPIAFALDGFAVYGSVEPDGSPMSTLDINHGHFGTDGVYHYHGTASAPYMVGKMVGVVTEDATYQIIPQPQASPVRPATNPLTGAVITSCVANGSGNGYILSYTLGGQTYSVDYNWNPGGNPGPYTYTFNFISPSGTTTQTYTNGFAQCDIVAGTSDIPGIEMGVYLYPNPVKDQLTIELSNDAIEKDIRSMAIYSYTGQRLFYVDHYANKINTSNLSKGVYLLKISVYNKKITKKLIIE
ncbi:MAG: T9SS type A sorting domain-containing protein [Flavobacteriia bacterium]